MTRFINKRTDKENKPPIQRKDSGSKENLHTVKSNKKICSYHKCKKEAVGRYTVDLDIKGLHYCKQHKKDISAAILWTILGIEEMAKHSMGVK